MAAAKAFAARFSGNRRGLYIGGKQIAPCSTWFPRLRNTFLNPPFYVLTPLRLPAALHATATALANQRAPVCPAHSAPLYARKGCSLCSAPGVRSTAKRIGSRIMFNNNRRARRLAAAMAFADRCSGHRRGLYIGGKQIAPCSTWFPLLRNTFLNPPFYVLTPLRLPAPLHATATAIANQRAPVCPAHSAPLYARNGCSLCFAPGVRSTAKRVGSSVILNDFLVFVQ